MKTELTSNEKSVLKAIVANAKQVGDNGVEFILADVAEEMGKNIRSISATAGSLAKKGMLLTANGDSYFDGELTEAGLHEVEENNENQDNMENIESVMDERIVKLNELKSVKLSSLTKTKRPAAKAAKFAAQFVLERWDDTEELQRLVDDEEMKMTAYEVWAIADSRIKQLTVLAAKEANYQRLLTEVRKKVSKVRADKQERKNILCLVKIEDKFVCVDEDAESFEKITKVKAEGVNGVRMAMFDEKDLDKYLPQLIRSGRKVAVIEDDAKQNKATSKAETASSDKTSTKRGRKPTVERKVGDRHPNGKWIWTEYAPGKFDWRTDPTQKHQGRTIQSEGKTEAKAGKKKPAKAEAPQPKRYNVEEWAAMTTRISYPRRNLSKSQKEALQYIYKGYRITPDRKFWRNEKGENKACVWGAVEALLKRYNTDYVPEGLIMEDAK